LFGTNWDESKFLLLNPLTARFPKLISGLQGAEGGFHPNEVAGALTWVLPLMISLSIIGILPHQDRKGDASGTAVFSLVVNTWQRWVGRFGIWTSTLGVMTVFVLTQSRSAYIGLGFTIMAMLFIAISKRWRWVSFGIILIVGLILGFMLSTEDFGRIQEWDVGSGTATESALSLNTLEVRLEIWSRAIYGLQDFPFTGMGMNTFREVVHVLYPLFLIAPDKDIGHAHNEFLQAGLGLGIPGMIGFLALYLISFWMLSDVWKRRKSNSLGFSDNLLLALLLGLGGGLLAHNRAGGQRKDHYL
jgi:O-antigen ligase